MTASQAPRPLAPLPIRVRPQRAETTESYARRLARANHLRPSYLRAFLCDPPRHTGAIRPWRLAAISGRSVRALEHALADLTQGSPPRRQPRAPGSVRTLISTWLLTEPELTPAQIWQRLLDEHDAGISYTTIGHYRRSIINSHYRLNAAFRAGSDDSNQPQSAITATFTRASHASPIASQTGPARSEPQSRADLFGAGQPPRGQRRQELVITARRPALPAMRYPARPSASCGAGTPFLRSPSLPRCTDARSASQATPPASFSILASARQEVLRELGRFTDPAVTSA